MALETMACIPVPPEPQSATVSAHEVFHIFLQRMLVCVWPARHRGAGLSKCLLTIQRQTKREEVDHSERSATILFLLLLLFFLEKQGFQTKNDLKYQLK